MSGGVGTLNFNSVKNAMRRIKCPVCGKPGAKVGYHWKKGRELFKHSSPDSETTWCEK